MFLKIKAIDISSECAILMDSDSGRIIYEQNIHKPKLIASLTKIMTAIMALESEKLDNIVTVDETVLKSYGTNLYLEVGEKISLRDLVYGLMLRSGNDAAMMIANYLSGSEEDFVVLMNQKANELGMHHTSFRNPHGLDEETENYSTAYDMALLTKYAMTQDEYQKIVKTKKHTVRTNYKTYVWTNKNKLLFSYQYLTGGKNGYTEKALKTLVTTATKGNFNLIAVTLNDPNQWKTHQDLHELGFSEYRNYKILNKKRFKVVEDTFYQDKLYIKHDFFYPLTKEEKELVYTKIEIEKLNNYQHSDKVGNVYVYLGDKKIHSQVIYVKKAKRNHLLIKLLKSLGILLLDTKKVIILLGDNVGTIAQINCSAWLLFKTKG